MTFLEWLASLFRPPVPEPLPKPVPPPSSTDFRARLLQLHNRFRATRGKEALVYHPVLERSAQWFADDLSAHPGIITGPTPHIGSDGSVLGERITRAGYIWSGVAENIAEGASPDQVEALWENHPPHASSILGPYTHMGVGRSGNFWCVDFGHAR